MNVGEIIKSKLIEIKADGLVNTWATCGCSIDDLAPCAGCNFGECQPAIKRFSEDEDQDMFYPMEGD